MTGLGPAPMAGMLLADNGAEVIRVDRVRPSGLGIPLPSKFDHLRRNRRSIALDLTNAEGVSIFLSLVGNADIVIEGFRPGVCERLGIGPTECLNFLN